MAGKRASSFGGRHVVASRSFLRRLTALFLCLAAWPCLAAATKPMEKLTDCQYVANAENDGDSFRVRSGEKEFLVRLYFVDAPETNLRYPDRTREQAEYFDATLDETLKGGRAARDLVRDTLKEPFTVWTRYASAAGRSAEPRYYVYILVTEKGPDGKPVTKGLDELLVSKGLALVKGVNPNLPTGEKAAAHVEKLKALEADAKKGKAGLWARPAEKKTDKDEP